MALLGVGNGVSSATARATHLRTVAARHRRRSLAPAPLHATEADPSRRGDVGGGFKYGSGASQSRRTGGDWASKEGAGDGGGGDYLRELGASQNYNINIDHGQSWANIDYLFAGERLGHRADIADGSLRSYETRSFAHLVGDYYIAPRFLEAVAMHITKNVLMDQGGIDGRVPLILGIWGGKGQGKSFQTELAFRKLGVVPIVMSAGELEHEWAGTPGRLIRERYRKASEVIRNQGRLSCLMINDLDAGIGRFGDTQVTVNNQMVVGTLMNICDDPKRVSLGEEWREAAELHRVPIIVTGNDFSRLYAPLVRDGRMEKFYWRPSKDDLLGILHAMYRDDGLSMDDVSTLLTSFPGQPLDFFGAIRAAVYDDHIKDWLSEVMQGSDPDCWEPRHLKELSRRLIHKEYLPDVDSVRVTLRMLLLQGRRLVAEQEHVMGNKLSEEYMKDLKREKEAAKRVTGSPVSSDRRPSPPPPPPESDDTKALFEKARAQLMKAGFIAPPEPTQQLDTSDQDVDSPWPRVDPVEAKHLMDTEGYVFVDVRPVKEFERESFLHALNIPVVKVNGFGSSATVEPLQTCFLEAVRERFPDFRNSKLLIVGDDDGEYAAHAIESLLDEGCTHAAEVCGGFSAWAKKFRPNGERRAEGGGWVSADGREELFGTGG